MNRLACWVAVCLLIASSTAANRAVAKDANLLTDEQSTFESDSPNASPRTAQGADPAGWTIINENDAGGGRSDICVENTGSPFDGGSDKSMLIFKSAAGSKQMFASLKLPQNQGGAFKFGFDFRLNSSTLSRQNEKLLFGVQLDGQPTKCFIIAIGAENDKHWFQSNNGTNPSFNINNWSQFKPDTWYRITGSVRRVGAVPNRVGDKTDKLTGLLGSFQLWMWDADKNAPVRMKLTNSNIPGGGNLFLLWPEVDSLPASIDAVHIATGYADNQGQMDFNVDNVFIKVPQTGDSDSSSGEPDDATPETE